MKIWLDRCESVCCTDPTLLPVDKVRLRTELQTVQVSFTVFVFLFIHQKIVLMFV